MFIRTQTYKKFPYHTVLQKTDNIFLYKYTAYCATIPMHRLTGVCRKMRTHALTFIRLIVK